MFDTFSEKTSDAHVRDDVHNESHSNTPPELQEEFKKHVQEGKKENALFEILKVVLLAVIIVTPIRLYVAQPFVVSGASMKETFQDGEYLVVDQLSYHFDKPSRGDVVIFKFPLEPSKFFIKRVIGLPNETVIVQGKAVIIQNDVHPNGVVLDEAYLSEEHLRDDFVSTTLKEGEYFVMGDNRKESSDSRSWGVLGEEYIIGRAFVRLFPVTAFDVFPGQDHTFITQEE